MKKLLSLVTVYIVIGCSGEKTTKLSGSIENMEGNSKLYISIINLENKQLEVIDSSDLTKEKNTFLFSIKLKEAGFVILNLKGEDAENTKELFLASGDNVKVSLDFAKGLEISESSGSKTLDQFTSIVEKVMQLRSEYGSDFQGLQQAKAEGNQQKIDELDQKMKESKEKVKRIPYDFFNENKDSEIIPWLFIYCTQLDPSVIDIEELRKMISELSPKIKETTWGKLIVQYYKTLKGNELENFELNDENDKKISLNNFRGKKVFIRFWVKGFEDDLFPFLQTVEDLYKEKLEIITIYVGNEQDKAIWLDVLNEKKTSWISLFSDMKITEKYFLSSPFSSFLLDENGIIIEKNLNDIDLKVKLEEIIK